VVTYVKREQPLGKRPITAAGISGHGTGLTGHDTGIAGHDPPEYLGYQSHI